MTRDGPAHGKCVKFGIVVYGLAAVAAGIVDMVWGQFESAHQPLQAWGDNLPGSRIFAYVIAAALVIGGAAVLPLRTRTLGAAAIALAYAVFAVFWLPRFVTAPRVLGYHPGVYIGILGGVFQQLVVVAAALLVYATTLPSASVTAQRMGAWARWIFGIGAIAFGLSHVTGVAVAARSVPDWMPFGHNFWVFFTGAAFGLAGIAFLTRTVDVLSARLLALMLLVFSAFTLLPLIFEYPHNQIAWGANAYNLEVAASAWILGCWLAAQRRAVPSPAPAAA